MKSDNHPTERRILRSEDESIDLEGVGTKCKNEDLALVDSISLYTLKMLKDSRYYVQHPYFRIFVAYFVVFCNFLIYAEDPVAHSVSECSLPVLGNAFSFVVIRWPDIAGYTILKAFMATLFLGCGMIFGKYIIHKRFLSGYLRLSAFRQSHGSFMVMFFTTIFSAYIGSLIYNLFLKSSPIYSERVEGWMSSKYMGMSNAVFMKLAASGTWAGDLFTAWMVTDVMLQEKFYPSWAQSLRLWWSTKYRRIIAFWVVIVISSLFVITIIATDVVRWDEFNMNILPTNELSRAFLASFILCCDLLIVVQDWDFPRFNSNLDVKLPGLTISEFKITLPANLSRIEISGKWFNYGIIFIVMLLDLNMWKNQIFYEPIDFGQYVGEDSRIYTVTKREYFTNNLTYEYRKAHINPLTNRTFVADDWAMNAKYVGYSLGVKCIALIPNVVAFLTFGFSVYYFGRLSTEQPVRCIKVKKNRPRRIERFLSHFSKSGTDDIGNSRI